MGTRPVTLCTAQWADVPFDELCVLAKKMGYDGLEVACWGEGIDIDKALTDDSYVAWIKDNLAKNGLVMKAMACHIIGQCVGDLPDPRLDNFAPPALAGQPEAIQKWAVETMKKAPAAAAKFGVKIITGFTGSPIWRYLYSFPQTPESMVEEGFDKIVSLWTPILDEFKSTAWSSPSKCIPARSPLTTIPPRSSWRSSPIAPSSASTSTPAICCGRASPRTFSCRTSSTASTTCT